MSEYFAIINNKQIGPVTADELIAYPGFTTSVYVWCNGMSDWCAASEVEEITAMLSCPPPISDSTNPTPPPAYHAPYTPPQQPPQYRRPIYVAVQDPGEDRGKPYSWMGWAIVATVIGVCFYVIGAAPGIIGIIYSSNARHKYDEGNFRGAYDDNNVAKIATIIGLCISGVFVLGLIIFFGIIISILPDRYYY